ncbi:MAG: dihydroneopterin aldolase [Bacteroidetes bacterium]|nr:dihydroneopterin aldolase [Bacteroidota bacterium]
MGQINIEGIKLYAYHGCLEEEAKIGSHYEVNVFIDVDFSAASSSDLLDKTVDYVVVYAIVKNQMAIRSNLLEQVGKRIFDEIMGAYKNIQKLSVSVSKINPPMNGNVSRVTVTVDK